MARDPINTLNDLRRWLTDKPTYCAQVIALRAASRALPLIVNSSEFWLSSFALLPFSAVLTSWFQLADRSIFVRTEESRSNARFGGDLFDFAGFKMEHIAALTADASYHSADAQSGSVWAASDCLEAVTKAADAFYAEPPSDTGPDFKPVSGVRAFWQSVAADCNWLSDNGNTEHASRELTLMPLWLTAQPTHWYRGWGVLVNQLRSIDPNYSVWIDWYERRVRGEPSSFDIPGDKRRVEDKKILRRLAEATDDDFWGKGHEYVNATLKGWLDEARARVAKNLPPIVAEASGTVSAGAFSTASVERGTPIETPSQEASAIAYGVNEQGKLDRLPNSDQAHLRDVPDQRRAYDDLREAAAELLSEGQRLGHRLQRALDRFLHSLPDGFEDAEAYLVWRDANALRRLHRAHREASKSPEPDEARLEPVVAEGLGGLLDLYNNFAFADDGLRGKDEARVAPQERASAEAEAKAAMPLVKAILANPEIATPEALDDIVADAENAELPAYDPYTDQVLDQANRTKRNWIAGLLSFGKRALEEAGKSRKEIRSGAERAVGALIVSDLAGVTSVASPLIEFIAAHASALKDYAAIAYSSLPSLSELIDRIKALLIQLRN